MKIFLFLVTIFLVANQANAHFRLKCHGDGDLSVKCDTQDGRCVGVNYNDGTIFKERKRLTPEYVQYQMSQKPEFCLEASSSGRLTVAKCENEPSDKQQFSFPTWKMKRRNRPGALWWTGHNEMPVFEGVAGWQAKWCPEDVEFKYEEAPKPQIVRTDTEKISLTFEYSYKSIRTFSVKGNSNSEIEYTFKKQNKKRFLYSQMIHHLKEKSTRSEWNVNGGLEIKSLNFGGSYKNENQDLIKLATEEKCDISEEAEIEESVKIKIGSGDELSIYQRTLTGPGVNFVFDDGYIICHPDYLDEKIREQNVFVGEFQIEFTLKIPIWDTPDGKQPQDQGIFVPVNGCVMGIIRRSRLGSPNSALVLCGERNIIDTRTGFEESENESSDEESSEDSESAESESSDDDEDSESSESESSYQESSDEDSESSESESSDDED